MNPVIVIPSFWASRRSFGSADRNAVYDRMTPISQPGNLGRCLDSLRRVDGLGRIVVLVVAESGAEGQAMDKVRTIASQFRDLDIAVVAQPEVRHIHRYMEQLGLGGLASCASLNGYGAIRNLGILTASIFGHDSVIFLDEDAIVSNRDFIDRALYGLGSKSPDGKLITAKTGVIMHEDDSYAATPDKRWYRASWDKADGYNKYMQPALEGPRLSRANIANGGLMVLHADAYGAVSFDPWITRGEDVDYVINSRMHNREVWLDSKLTVQQLSQETTRDTSAQFEQDVYRWYYENRKIEFTKAQIDLMQIDPHSLDPYPGPWITKKIGTKALVTCLLSIIGDPEHMAYWRIATNGRKHAAEYARENCMRYFEFQHQWPALVRSLWNCTPLATQLSGARSVGTSAAGFTGRFSAV